MPVNIGELGIWHPHAAGKASALRQNPDVNLIAVCEPDRDVRAERGGHDSFSGVPMLDDVAAFLATPGLDAVVVEGRVGDNVGLAKRALKAGKHVMLEKPAGTTYDPFVEIVDLAHARGLVLQMGYNFRYCSGLEFARCAAADGLLGDVFFVRGRISTSKSLHEQFSKDLAHFPGGVFFELACHLLDTVVAMLGEPDSVCPFLRRDYGSEEAFDDNTLVVIEYPTALVSLETSAIEIDPTAHRRFEVCGTQGSVIVEPLEPSKVLLCLEEPAAGYAKGWQAVDAGNRPRYVKDIEELVACIRGEKSPEFSSAHDLAVHRTLLKAGGVG